MPLQSTAQDDVNDVIREAMREQSVSQLTLAQAIGITQTQVSARLRGEIDWRARELDVVGRVLNITVTLGGAA